MLGRLPAASTRGAIVNFEKLVKQLRRDMTANPKKAAALGLMVLVALYFWGPLIGNWVTASREKRSSKVDMAALILTDDPAEPTQQTKARGGAKFRWEKVRQLIEDDPHMRPAVFDPTWTNPFGRSAVLAAMESTMAESAKALATAAPESVTTDPAELNLVLNGIFIGAKSRVATINGEPCYEGDVVRLADKENPAAAHQVRVARIQRKSVVLDVNGQPFTLELSTPQLARGDEIERTRHGH